MLQIKKEKMDSIFCKNDEECFWIDTPHLVLRPELFDEIGENLYDFDAFGGHFVINEPYFEAKVVKIRFGNAIKDATL